MRVFLSSTKADLTEFREAVFSAIKDEHEVTRMEDYPSDGRPPLQFCLDRVDQADAVVLLIGYRYGSRSPEAGVSYTEAEYERAQSQGIGVLPYIRAQFDAGVDQQDQSAEDRASLRAFREQVEAEQTVRRPYFEEPLSLAKKVRLDLGHWDELGHLRPTFGPGTGRIRDPVKYARETTRQSTMRGLAFPVTLVNLATMQLERYPADSGGRLVAKLSGIEAGLLDKGVQVSIFNNLRMMQTDETSVLEQRISFLARNSELVVCFAKSSEDIGRLEAFEEMQEKVAVWHPTGTDLPPGFIPMYSQQYTPEDLKDCLLRIEAFEHVLDVVNQRLLEELAR